MDIVAILTIEHTLERSREAMIIFRYDHKKGIRPSSKCSIPRITRFIIVTIASKGKVRGISYDYLNILQAASKISNILYNCMRQSLLTCCTT